MIVPSSRELSTGVTTFESIHTGMYRSRVMWIVGPQLLLFSSRALKLRLRRYTKAQSELQKKPDFVLGLSF